MCILALIVPIAVFAARGQCAGLILVVAFVSQVHAELILQLAAACRPAPVWRGAWALSIPSLSFV